jgi:hypothetical protein
VLITSAPPLQEDFSISVIQIKRGLCCTVYICTVHMYIHMYIHTAITRRLLLDPIVLSGLNRPSPPHGFPHGQAGPLVGRRSEPPEAEPVAPPASRTPVVGAAGTPVGVATPPAVGAAGTCTPVGAAGTPVGVATAPVCVARDPVLPAMRSEREWVHYMCCVRGGGEGGEC